MLLLSKKNNLINKKTFNYKKKPAQSRLSSRMKPRQLVMILPKDNHLLKETMEEVDLEVESQEEVEVEVKEVL